MPDLTFHFRVPCKGLWLSGTTVHYGSGSAHFDGEYLTADTEDALKAIMLAFDVKGEIEEYVEKTEEDHLWVPADSPVQEG